MRCRSVALRKKIRKKSRLKFACNDSKKKSPRTQTNMTIKVRKRDSLQHILKLTISRSLATFKAQNSLVGEYVTHTALIYRLPTTHTYILTSNPILYPGIETHGKKQDDDRTHWARLLLVHWLPGDGKDEKTNCAKLYMNPAENVERQIDTLGAQAARRQGGKLHAPLRTRLNVRAAKRAMERASRCRRLWASAIGRVAESQVSIDRPTARVFRPYSSIPSRHDWFHGFGSAITLSTFWQSPRRENRD